MDSKSGKRDFAFLSLGIVCIIHFDPTVLGVASFILFEIWWAPYNKNGGQGKSHPLISEES